MPASRADPFFAWSVAIWIWRASAYMSGASRQPTRTEGSTFFAAANASALSRTADIALSPISKAGRDAWDSETGMIDPLREGRRALGASRPSSITPLAPPHAAAPRRSRLGERADGPHLADCDAVPVGER